MNKVVINAKYGGFRLSTKAAKILIEQGVEDIEVDEDGWVLGCWDLCRHDPRLVEVVEKLGDAASGECSRLIVETIPGNRYRSTEYDGLESLEYPGMMENKWTVIDSLVGAG